MLVVETTAYIVTRLGFSEVLGKLCNPAHDTLGTVILKKAATGLVSHYSYPKLAPAYHGDDLCFRGLRCFP